MIILLITPYTPTTELPLTTSDDPAVDAAVTTSIISGYSGVVITLSGAGNAQTLQPPGDTTPGKRFVVICDDASGLHTIVVNGVTMSAGEAQNFIWEGTSWTVTSVSGATVSDGAYGPGWDGVAAIAASKNAVYDEMETKLDPDSGVDGGGF